MHGGAAVLVPRQLKILDVHSNNANEAFLRQTNRFAAGLVALDRKGHNLHLWSAYAISGGQPTHLAQTNQLMRAIFRKAAALGSVPIILSVDLQATCEEIPAVVEALFSSN